MWCPDPPHKIFPSPCRSCHTKRRAKKKGGSLIAAFLSCHFWLEHNKFSQSINHIITTSEPGSTLPSCLSQLSHSRSEWISALNSLRVSSVSRSLEGVGDLSARRALNNREGRNKRNKQHQPSVFQQQREDTGITMPEPVPKGMQILSIKA